MARINLICKCGWKFFIAETAQGHEVTCPNCTEGVPIPGREAGQGPVSPGMLAAQKQTHAARVKLLVGLVAGIVVVVVALVVVLNKKDAPEPEDSPAQASGSSQGRRGDRGG